MSRELGNKGEDLWIKTINSGAFYQKGDGIRNEECVEIKTTKKKSFSLTTEFLKKIWNDAFDQNKFPIFGIVIRRDNVDWILKVDIVKKMK